MKLLLSEIEHLTDVEKKIDLSTATLVYFGAGGGEHLPVLSYLFPKLHMILVDDHFSIKPTNKIEIMKEYASDEKIEKYKSKAKKNIIFVSDIRKGISDTFEEDVHSDMICQMKWGVQLNAYSMLLKFRLPYTDAVNEYNTVIDPSIRKYVVAPKQVPKDKYLYLKGEPFIQAYSPLYSTEARLSVFKRRDGKWDTALYDPKEYENAFFYHNEIRRSSNTQYRESQFVPYHIAGMDFRFDSVLEFYILRRYTENRREKNIFQETIKIMKTIHDMMHYDIMTKTLESIREYGKRKRMFNLMNNYIRSMKNYYRTQADMIKYHKQSSVFSQKEYNKQIEQLKKISSC